MRMEENKRKTQGGGGGGRKWMEKEQKKTIKTEETGNNISFPTFEVRSYFLKQAIPFLGF